MNHADSTGAPKRRGRGLTAFASAIAGIPLALAVQPSPGEAKAPGVSHCYRSICHRVRTVEQTRRMIGRSFTVETSYYDLPGRDRFNTGTYTSNGERFDANDSARVASADLPDGTELLLRNPVNGRVSHVRVNDFGPFRGNRRLDVTRRVAEDLDFKHKGVVRLDVIVIAAPGDEDLTYRRNRERRTTRGHLGVVFDAEMPALIAGLVDQRNPAPGAAPAASLVAFAAPGDTADYERLADASSGAPQAETAPSHVSGVTVVVYPDDVEAHVAFQAHAELAGTDASFPAVGSALDASPAGAPDEAREHTIPARQASLPDASHPEIASLAQAAIATSDLGAAATLISTNRNLLIVILAGLLSALVAASLAAGHRMPRRTAPARQPGAARVSWLTDGAGSARAEARPPVAPDTAPAGGRASPPEASVTIGAARPAVAPGDHAASYIAADIAIEGQVRSQGRVEIAGRIKGRIEADEVIVLEGGVLEGDAICRVLDVAGTISGAIGAHELHVRATGRVEASIETAIVWVEAGAWFVGQVRHRRAG